MKEGGLDEKTKAAKIKKLEAEIARIKAEIQQQKAQAARRGGANQRDSTIASNTATPCGLSANSFDELA